MQQREEKRSLINSIEMPEMESPPTQYVHIDNMISGISLINDHLEKIRKMMTSEIFKMVYQLVYVNIATEIDEWLKAGAYHGPSSLIKIPVSYQTVVKKIKDTQTTIQENKLIHGSDDGVKKAVHESLDMLQIRLGHSLAYSNPVNVDVFNKINTKSKLSKFPGIEMIMDKLNKLGAAEAVDAQFFEKIFEKAFMPIHQAAKRLDLVGDQKNISENKSVQADPFAVLIETIRNMKSKCGEDLQGISPTIIQQIQDCLTTLEKRYCDHVKYTDPSYANKQNNKAAEIESKIKREDKIILRADCSIFWSCVCCLPPSILTTLVCCCRLFQNSNHCDVTEIGADHVRSNETNWCDFFAPCSKMNMSWKDRQHAKAELKKLNEEKRNTFTI